MESESRVDDSFVNLRKDTRYAIQSELILTMSTGRSLKGMTVNISAGGALISSKHQGLNVGDQVFVELIGKYRYDLGFLIAKVIHHREDLIRADGHCLSGLQFTHLTKLQKVTIDGLLSNTGGFV